MFFYTAQFQIAKFEKLRNKYKRGNYLSVADMLNRSSTQKELQRNQLEHKQLPPQIHSATLTHDKQIKPVHFLIKHETVLPSQEDDFHPILVDFEDDQFSIRINDKEKTS